MTLLTTALLSKSLSAGMSKVLDLPPGVSDYNEISLDIDSKAFSA